MRKKSWHSPQLEVLELGIFLNRLVEVLLSNRVKVIVDDCFPPIPLFAADHGSSLVQVSERIAKRILIFSEVHNVGFLLHNFLAPQLFFLVTVGQF